MTILKNNVRYLTDTGLETTLIFLDRRELPAFAAFVLLSSAEGRERLERYYREHADVARAHAMGFVFEAPSWRASSDWAAQLGYSAGELTHLNTEAIAFLRTIAADYEDIPTLVSGQIGPRGDGYRPGAVMTAEEAEAYHSVQIEAFREADLVTALTMTTCEEAIGIVRAARTSELAVVISFTVETDGRLATGMPLGEAIAEVDARTKRYASHFMINCAHPENFMDVLDETVATRVRGLRANASTASHEELDNAPTLDIGDPRGLGLAYRKAGELLPHLAVVGGCCGTDIRHMHQIVEAAAP